MKCKVTSANIKPKRIAARQKLLCMSFRLMFATKWRKLARIKTRFVCMSEKTYSDLPVYFRRSISYGLSWLVRQNRAETNIIQLNLMANGIRYGANLCHLDWNDWRVIFMALFLSLIKKNISYNCYHGEKKITKGKLKLWYSFPFFLRTPMSDKPLSTQTHL